MSTIPAGTYAIDPAHSEVGFSVRHSGIARVRGRFTDFAGTFTVAENLTDSSASATIASWSVRTGHVPRDQPPAASDFWDAEKNPEWTSTSSSVSGDGAELVLHGALTTNGVTKPAALDVEFNGALGE